MTRHDDAPDASRRAHIARARRLRTDALAFVHADPRLVRAVEDAKTAVIAPRRGDDDGAAQDSPEAGAADALLACAALVLTEHDTARALIDGIVNACAGNAEGDVACLTAAWLAARWYAWTGRAAASLPWLEPVAACLARPGGAAPRAPAPADLRRLVARELIALAEAGPDAGLRRQVRQLAGGADPARSADAVLGLLPAPLRPVDPRTVLEDLFAGRTTEGAAGWTTLALAGSAEADAWLVPLLVAGVLGCDPDAERGRLRLRLHVPEAWPAWGVDRLRIGDAAIELRVERDAGNVEITADQVSGPLPLTLILEPTVHAPVAAALVDGRPAELALRPLADRVVAPVQLVLDAPRQLTLRLGVGQ